MLRMRGRFVPNLGLMKRRPLHFCSEQRGLSLRAFQLFAHGQCPLLTRRRVPRARGNNTDQVYNIKYNMHGVQALLPSAELTFAVSECGRCKRLLLMTALLAEWLQVCDTTR